MRPRSARLLAGNLAAAINPLEHGLRLNPYDPRNFHWYRVLALSQYFAGQHQAALEAAFGAQHPPRVAVYARNRRIVLLRAGTT